MSLPNITLTETYEAATPRSAELARRARELLPSGIAHDGRKLDPYPVYVDRAKGPRKWDVDGNEYVDYFGGHGALLFGHAHAPLVEAIQRQATLGTHWGASHELEVQWAELVQRLVPSAERVRFTASGTEATQLALRLARAYTGKTKIVRFVGHFHGWHDAVAPGAMSHYDGSIPAGIPAAVVGESIVLSADAPGPAVDVLESRDDIAAVIVEPSGASWGQVPLPAGFLATLRAATKARSVPLIFDEVITGSRWPRGGAQAGYGIVPDVTVLAKILAGGLPGGAVAGAKDILDQIDPVAAKAAGREKVGHQGTFNANPLCAAAGVTMLSLVGSTDACEHAERTAEELRAAMRRVLVEEGMPWGVFGQASVFVIFPNPARLPIDPANFDPLHLGFKGLKGSRDPQLNNKLRLALLAHGVDIAGGPGGFVSAAHGPREVAQTLEAWRSAVRALKNELR